MDDVTSTLAASGRNLFEDVVKRSPAVLKDPDGNPITVRDAIEFSAVLHETGTNVREFNMAMYLHDPVQRMRAIREHTDLSSHTRADKIIQHFAMKFMCDTLSNQKEGSTWQREVRGYVTRPSKGFTHTDIRVIATLPRFHEYDCNYMELTNHYGVETQRDTIDRDTVYSRTLTPVTQWPEYNSKEVVIVFSFYDQYNRLVMLRADDRATNEALFAQHLMTQGKMELEFTGYYRTIGTSQYALHIKKIKSFKNV